MSARGTLWLASSGLQVSSTAHMYCKRIGEINSCRDNAHELPPFVVLMRFGKSIMALVANYGFRHHLGMGKPLSFIRH